MSAIRDFIANGIPPLAAEGGPRRPKIKVGFGECVDTTAELFVTGSGFTPNGNVVLHTRINSANDPGVSLSADDSGEISTNVVYTGNGGESITFSAADNGSAGSGAEGAVWSNSVTITIPGSKADSSQSGCGDDGVVDHAEQAAQKLYDHAKDDANKVIDHAEKAGEDWLDKKEKAAEKAIDDAVGNDKSGGGGGDGGAAQQPVEAEEPERR